MREYLMISISRDAVVQALRPPPAICLRMTFDPTAEMHFST